ncbi:mas-related G-protein coupled receptor member X1-like [Phascolarctos cinereus]|uniref:Mas-related G-protein coupled receptor member X1-like n=1 Tax=Phascolarctos cinereus TaxID=38626 RepID=A0A6P5J671_PHACI|nr:mas-related G-protein coupled receptor member X1-like [Phascolarctos cinereus]
MSKEELSRDFQMMDLITWDLSSPQLPWELDYNKRAVPISWAEKTSAQKAILPIPCLTVLIASWGLIGNSIILWLLGFQIKRGPFTVYILNMTTADFFFLFCHIVNIMGKLLFSLDSNPAFLILTEFCASLSENFLVAMSMELCLSVLCPVWYRWNRPKLATAIVCSLIWVLTALLSGTEYFLCKHSSSSNGCKVFIRSNHMWLLLLFLLYVVSLTLLFCIQCSRCRCPKSSSLWVLAVLIILQLLLSSLPFVTGQFNSEFKVMILQSESDFNLIHSESDSVIFETEDDVDILLSCLENSTEPFTYFFMSCCKKRRARESFRMLLQRTLMDEEELEWGTEIFCESPGLVTLTLRTLDRSSEEPMTGDTTP